MTLTDFLLARIAEDEGIAREASPGGWHGRHIARHDPARVLAECEAKRRVVALCDDYEEPAPSVLRALALPYADHADYREDW